MIEINYECRRIFESKKHQPMKNLLFIAFMLLSTIVFGQKNVLSIEGGLIEGTTNANGDIQIFKGIPFAAPPVGDLRWKAPQPVEAWEGVKKCDRFGPSPMQAPPHPFMFWSSEFLIPEEPISEDCLYLNVWSGAKAADEARPVLVYIYGGGFRSGGAGCPIYDGEAMAKKGVVFVSINYRVGIFGFLAHPELSQEAEYKSSGNYALLDMIAALDWVQKNIAAFGGNPNNVTIAGQSAGAFGVNFLTASPVAKGLFHRAIAQSGGSFYSNPSRPGLDLKSAEQQGVDFAKALDCQSLAELRAKSADSIQQAQGGLAFPIIDGYLLPKSVYDIYANGEQNDVPLLIGWNQDDIVFMQSKEVEAFRKQIEERFGDLAADFFAAYPAGTAKEAAQSQLDMGRDEIFGIQVYTWAKLQSQTGKSPAFVYNFNRQVPAHTPDSQFGAFHSGEIVYAYDNLHTLDRPWEEVDETIADKMSDYWSNFAKKGNPNGKGLVLWEPFDPGNEKVMILDKTLESKALPSQKQIMFWERYFLIDFKK